MVATGLTVGNTYYMRVYDYRSQYAWQDPAYDLCVVEGLGSGLGLAEGIGASQSTIYPNPTNGDFSVRVDPCATVVNINVIDATGRSVIARQRIPTNGQVRVEGAGALVPGIYIVRIDAGSTITDHRLVVQE